MSGNVRQQQAAVESVVLSLAFILVALVFVLGFAWLKAHTAISRAVLEFMAFQILHFDWTPARHAHALADEIRTIPASSLSIIGLFRVVGAVSALFAVPLSIFVTVLGIILVIFAPASRYATPLNLDGLIKVQAPVFRSIAAYLPRRLVPVAPNLPAPRPADPALHLGEWLACHALGERGVFQQDQAVAALEAQLGDPWSGIDRAPAPARMMIAVCGLHACRRRKEAAALLGLVSESLAVNAAQEGGTGPEHPLVLSPAIMQAVDRILSETPVRSEVEPVLRQHGFVTTAVMGLLNFARARAGLLPPAQFNFLKLIDRNLWYALQSLGFPVSETEDGPFPNPKIEALGARAHWQTERAERVPLVLPHIEMAIDLVVGRVDAASTRQQPLKDLR
ncbi:hypothetical protein [Acidiphilium rubrum]|uniref:secretion/conjugation apparatus DotM-related subunit n=2 Tax=Acidiphilium TaxID=522 RepID=UPI002CEB159C|nr:hypothetical protein [Acidiphilium rubrum]HQT86838.1 hypothetical protein [Acidiphilium rubrum]HQT86844.1 hypothetical protein [Acidiphilium rubrum]